MSSSEGQESRVDSQVVRALEAAKDPFLRKIAERFQKEPNQILKLSEILGFTTEEEKNTKALVWLKKHEPEKYRAVLQSSKAENKKPEEEKMEVRWGNTHFYQKVESFITKLMKQAIRKEEVQIYFCQDWASYHAPGDRALGKTFITISPLLNKEFLTDGIYWRPARIRVTQKEYLWLAKRFAQLYEKKTGTTVVIQKEY